MRIWSPLVFGAAFLVPVTLMAGVVQFSAAGYRASEKVRAVRLMVLRSGDLSTTDVVQFATADVTARDGQDYVGTNGTLVFRPRVRRLAFSVPLIADTAHEENETFAVSLASPAGATLGAPSTAAVTIVDDDPAGSIRFGAKAYRVIETARAATITVLRSGGTAGGITVDFAAMAGTATAEDFVTTNGTLTFGPREVRKTFTVPILQDTVAEPAETVQLTLSNPTGGAALGTPSSSVLRIMNKGGTPLVCSNASIAVALSDPSDANASTTPFVAEHGGAVLVAFNLTPDAPTTVFSGEALPCGSGTPVRRVEFGIYDPAGTPTAGKVYQLGFPNGENSQENYVEYYEDASDASQNRRWRSIGIGTLTIDSVGATTIGFHVTGAAVTAQSYTTVHQTPNEATGTVTVSLSGTVPVTRQQ